jgi:DNA polymerase-3 subunit epsilon
MSNNLPEMSGEHQPPGIQLERPLVFIDVETTGVNIVTDRIIEIALIRINPDGKKDIKRKLINPEIPIPAQAIAIHGITNEMVKDAPTFKEVVNEITQFIQNCDLAGYNSNRFDIPIFAEEMLRTGISWKIEDAKLLDVQKIFHLMILFISFHCLHQKKKDLLKWVKILKVFITLVH